jgi:hypothetical protein
MLIQFKKQVINWSETYPKTFKWEPSKYAQRNANKMKEKHLLQLFIVIYVMCWRKYTLFNYFFLFMWCVG